MAKDSEVIRGIGMTQTNSVRQPILSSPSTTLIPFVAGSGAILALQNPAIQDLFGSVPFVSSIVDAVDAVFVGYFVLASGALLLLVYIYQVLFRPVDIFRPHEFKKSAVRRAEALQLGFPKQFANGWFRLFDTSSLTYGQVEQIKVFTKQLVVFRTEAGQAVVLDAYCPHLGANLSVMGTVVGENVRCPFHGWEFDHTGKCVKIPYTDRAIPEAARVRAWPTVEVNGSIYIWHHAEGLPPSWDLPVISKQLVGGPIIYHGRTIHHVEAHSQEIPENGADVAHLGILHVPLIVEWLGRLTALEHAWTATWDKGTADAPWMTNITLTQAVSWRGKTIPWTMIPVSINQCGPGVVHLHFDTPFGRCYIIECVTPLKLMLQQCSHIVFADKGVPRWFAKFVLRGLVIQFERDIPIWNNKAYVSRPILVQGDGKINQFRRWYSQFYSPVADSGMPQEQLSW